jgi:hypothetical protein
MSRLIFDSRRPLFVAQPFQAYGKNWTVDDHFPWELIGIDFQDRSLHMLYDNNFLQHRPDLESSMLDIVKKTIGDGLESLTIEALHNLRDSINKQVKAKVSTARDYEKKKCAFSSIKDKQIGKIRSWRAAYGHMENY